MTILIANIGTSDLAVKVNKYYIPIGLNLNEPNIDLSGLEEEEEDIKNSLSSYITDNLCPELGVEVNNKFSFREFTYNLLEAYKKSPSEWHNRIRPGRIQGIINTAINQFNAKLAYIFVTDQPKKHPDDSIYLFNILKKWFWDEMGFELFAKYIPREISPVNDDQLLDFYYHFFQKQISDEEEILISIKGGTPQMINALKLQAVSSTIPKQLFIDPYLSLKEILHGEPSQCQLTTYWKYMRNQKYQTVEQLLERWDFDGAINILRDWQKVLNFLINKKVLDQKQIQESRDLVHLVTHGLETARSLFNLDVEGARNIINENNELSSNEEFKLSEFVNENNYDSLLNLYTQCCIYHNLLQIANFLTRVGSFYERVIYRLMIDLGGKQYFNRYLDNAQNQYQREIWKIHRNSFKNAIGQDLYDEFLNLEGKNDLRRVHSIKIDRYSKLHYVHILIKSRYYNNTNPNNIHPKNQYNVWLNNTLNINEETSFTGVFQLLESLNYWIELRNNLIHNGEGISNNRINEFNQFRNENRQENACKYEEILDVLSTIINSGILNIRRQYREEFVEKDKYYIYSNAKDSANTLLMADAADNY